MSKPEESALKDGDDGQIVRRDVVLVHGLGRTARSMHRLERRLNKAGFTTHNFDYSARNRAFAEIVGDFQSYLDALPDVGQQMHFVGHSLGGLLIRGGLAGQQRFEIGRIVMMATPNKGVGIIDRLEHTGLPELLFGPSVKDLGPSAPTFQSLGVPGGEIGIIAGTRPFHPLNPSSWLNSVLQAKIIHDGTVEVASTRLPVMKDYIELPISHTFMPLDERVIEQVIAFLQTGRFNHDGSSRSQADRFLAAWTELVKAVRHGLLEPGGNDANKQR